jgi:hypothetical protein
MKRSRATADRMNARQRPALSYLAAEEKAAIRAPLLLLFGMHGVLTESRRILGDFELLAARLATNRVVVVARLFAHEEYGFDFLLALGHDEDNLLDRQTAGKIGSFASQTEPRILAVSGGM